MSERPAGCCGACPEIVGGGYDCTCEDNPRCPNYRGRLWEMFNKTRKKKTHVDILEEDVSALYQALYHLIYDVQKLREERVPQLEDRVDDASQAALSALDGLDDMSRDLYGEGS